MQSGWRIGSLLGIPLFIDPSWFVIVALIALVNGWDWQLQYANWSSFLAGTVGLITALLLFGSVLLHELGHSLVARAQGIRVNSITLFLFGGMAALDRESKTPGQAFQVAIAGPAVSLLFFVLLHTLQGSLPVQSPPAVLTGEIAHLNLVLGLFNLIPGLPLDGGQILKSAVWKLTDSRFQGVHWAARTGKTLGWFAVLLGLSDLLWLDDGSGLWIMLLGWFAIRNAQQYDRLTTLQEVLLDLSAGEIQTRSLRVVNGSLSLGQFIETYLMGSTGFQSAVQPVAYYAAAAGRYLGWVDLVQVRQVERSLWERWTVAEVVRHLGSIATVTEAASVAAVIHRLEADGVDFVTVLSPAGAVAGVIDRGDIVKAVADRLGFPITSEEVRHIKQDGAFPPGLGLGPIARSLLEDLEP
ncbi:MAG: site-2 protease family protein [Prochlorothrix sp.]|nr:site-2 protease family protein [Prochlorothrix sp.]